MSTGEDELEKFRRQWREEVTRRDRAEEKESKKIGRPNSNTISSLKGPRKNVVPPPSSRSAQTAQDDLVEPRTFHDLPDREEALKLEKGRLREEVRFSEPVTALDYYEKAAEEEAAGKLGNSVASYRRAFKLDSRVHHAYKEKHFPHPGSAQRQSVNEDTLKVEAKQRAAAPAPGASSTGRTIVNELIDQFSGLEISPTPPETDLSKPPPCPIARIPTEVLVAILQSAIRLDVAMASHLALVCKRFAYLVMTENSIWKSVVLGTRFGLKSMHYRYCCDLRGFPLSMPNPPNVMPILSNYPKRVFDLTPSVYPTYRNQFRHRPRIRFNGCYISTVNYQRQGASAQSQYTWVNPIHIVTYYRYLRFFRDGTVISLLTTTEPADVVHHLRKENLHDHHAGGLPTYVMKDALHGRWRLSGPASSISAEDTVATALSDSPKGPGEYAKEPPADWTAMSDELEVEGDIHVETEGVIPKYMWKMQFALTSAGRKDGPRNNKLNWKAFWSYNRLTDDWGEFGLKNDRPYYFSRVKSYGLGLES